MYCVLTMAMDELPASCMTDTAVVCWTRDLRCVQRHHLEYDHCSVSNVLAFVTFDGRPQTDGIVAVLFYRHFNLARGRSVRKIA
jgi:hypothetical protein